MEHYLDDREVGEDMGRVVDMVDYCATQFAPNGSSFKLIDPDQSTLRESLPGCGYEPAVAGLIKEIFETARTGTFLDVGALYGYFSCYVASLFPDVDIVAFEPNARSAAFLRENVRINGYRKVTVEQVALAHEDGVQAFRGKSAWIKPAEARRQGEQPTEVRTKNVSATAARIEQSPTWIGWLGSVMHHAGRLASGWHRLEWVKSVRFDSHHQQHFRHPTVVKIDVHGAEVSVLSGMSEYLRRSLDVLFLELHTDGMLTHGSHSDTVRILKESGLDLYELIDFRRADRWRARPLNDQDLDLLATSSRWGIKERITMRMILGTRRGAQYVVIPK